MGHDKSDASIALLNRTRASQTLETLGRHVDELDRGAALDVCAVAFAGRGTERHVTAHELAELLAAACALRRGRG